MTSGFTFFLLNEGVADVSPGALSNSEIWVTNIYWDALCTTLSAGAQKWKDMAPSPQRIQACKWDSCMNQLAWYMLSALMRNTGL